MLSHDPLPAPAYNSLPQIDGQGPIDNDDLVGLGRIFTSHGLHRQLGVGLLHRHFDLDEGEIMRHDGLRCAPQALSDASTTLGGSSFFLDGNQFNAFEYDTENPLQVHPDFLEQVAIYLTQKGLTHRLALSKLDGRYGRLVETLDVQERAHVCAEAPDDEPLTLQEVTEWRFEIGQDRQVRPVVARACKQTASGAHKRTK